MHEDINGLRSTTLVFQGTKGKSKELRSEITTKCVVRTTVLIMDYAFEGQDVAETRSKFWAAEYFGNCALRERIGDVC